uniref:PiggyBac transposable element-derived protein domain-containing protein n=1 Tax=Photinus pyralis TaxID=7054 RepID=A0A1Y1M9S5_PHOPY
MSSDGEGASDMKKPKSEITDEVSASGICSHKMKSDEECAPDSKNPKDEALSDEEWETQSESSGSETTEKFCSENENFSDDDDSNDSISDTSEEDFEESEEDEQEEDDATASKAATPNWSSEVCEMKAFDFLKSGQLLLEIPGDREPIDYFRAIFDDEILNLMVTATNQYAEEMLLSPGQSRITEWKPVTPQEMLIFVALVLHTGTLKLDRLRDYWKDNRLFNLKSFSQHMDRDRFLLLMDCLSFSQKLEEPSTDRLHKVRPMIDFFNNKMAATFYPDKELSLDEPMFLQPGRFIFRSHFRDKHLRYGIYLHTLTGPHGVILKLFLHPGYAGKARAIKVVLKLLENYLDVGHSVYLDKYYNSYALAEELGRRKTHCTGPLNTLRKGNPRDVVKKNLQRREKVAAYCNGIMVGKWNDILYISNEHPNQTTKFTDRRNRTRQKATPVFYYNKYMSDYDHWELIDSHYPCSTITLKWYKKLGIHFIQLMLINAYSLYKKYSQQNAQFYHFRLAVLKSLLSTEEQKPLKPSPKPGHVISKIPSVNKNGETNRKRCRVCSQNKVRKMTIYHCAACPDQPGLCVGECFDTFHS